ncbi:MAG: DUF3221 domain-containing protein [Lachnospiraceae bacterium]|nr:DUF3221 domain-containing protein [Lachnospiraceae bacterium]
MKKTNNKKTTKKPATKKASTAKKASANKKVAQTNMAASSSGKKPNVLAIVAILIVAALCFGSFFYYKNFNQAKPAAQKTATATVKQISNLTGKFVKSIAGDLFLITDANSPVIMKNETGNANAFSNLKAGDVIEITTKDGVMETYPAQTSAKEVKLVKNGALGDINIDTLHSLNYLGFDFSLYEYNLVNGKYIIKDSGLAYKELKKIEGIVPGSKDKEKMYYIVLTNNPDIKFETISWSLVGAEYALDPFETRLIWIGKTK